MGASTYDSSKRRRLGETRRQSLQTCSLRECKISCVPPYENRPEKKSCTIPAKLTRFVEAPTHVTFRGVRQLQSGKPVPHTHTNLRCWHRRRPGGEAGSQQHRSVGWNFNRPGSGPHSCRAKNRGRGPRASTYDSWKRRRLGETRRQSLQTCSARECKISCVPPYENRPEKKSCTIP